MMAKACYLNVKLEISNDLNSTLLSDEHGSFEQVCKVKIVKLKSEISRESGIPREGCLSVELER